MFYNDSDENNVCDDSDKGDDENSVYNDEDIICYEYNEEEELFKAIDAGGSLPDFWTESMKLNWFANVLIPNLNLMKSRETAYFDLQEFLDNKEFRDALDKAVREEAEGFVFA